VFCLPVPEKAKRQHNFVIIPHGGDGLTAPASGIATPEPFVWTVVETGPREEVAESEPALTTRLLNEQLSKYGRAVIYPDGNEFASEIPPTGRPGEKSYHVRAHRGSKDGIPSLSFIVALDLTNLITRLPLLPQSRHRLGLQETSTLPPIQRHHQHQLHQRLTANVQPQRHCVDG